MDRLRDCFEKTADGGGEQEEHGKYLVAPGITGIKTFLDTNFSEVSVEVLSEVFEEQGWDDSTNFSLENVRTLVEEVGMKVDDANPCAPSSDMLVNGLDGIPHEAKALATVDKEEAMEIESYIEDQRQRFFASIPKILQCL